jgi:hypothetical protein
MDKGIPWQVWAIVTILVAIIGAYATINVKPNEPPPSGVSVPAPENDQGSGSISGKYLMDQLEYRVIVVTHLSGSNVRIEEPSGSYPWRGTATLDGSLLTGEARFVDSLASMRIEGQIRSDGSIAIRYIFITDSEGKPENRRIDNHVWYPSR